MRLLRRLLAIMLLATSSATMADDIVKAPDLGAYYSPLSSSGSFTYANSFVAPDSGAVSGLGVWLRGGASDLQYKVFGSIGGNSSLGPDSSNVLASTGVLPGQLYNDLTFVGITSGIASSMLVAGQTYWFAATTVGLGGSGEYTAGGHTQNSGGIVDNGTFWYSNDPTGAVFAGTNFTPEMAFSVSVVPEPSRTATLALGLGLVGLLATRRRSGDGKTSKIS